MNAATRAISHEGDRVIRPSGLTVLYDAHCPVCRQARRWVEAHRHLVSIRFVPAGSPLAARRFPDLDVGATLVDVTVVTHEGAVLRGDRAWIAVLWAVARTRRLAVELAHGRRTRVFRGVKGATDAVRRLASRQPDVHRPGPFSRADPTEWPPPPTAPNRPGGACDDCRS